MQNVILQRVKYSIEKVKKKHNNISIYSCQFAIYAQSKTFKYRMHMYKCILKTNYI